MNPDTHDTINRNIAPDVHDMGPLSLAEDNSRVLPNGVTLHTLSGGDTEVCRVKVFLPGGKAESPRPQLFHIANSLLLEGTTAHPGDRLADILDITVHGVMWRLPPITRRSACSPPTGHIILSCHWSER